MSQSSNPVDAIKASPQEELKVKQDDPDLLAAVGDFIKHQETGSSAAPAETTEPGATPEPPPQAKEVIAPDLRGLEATPQDDLMTEALVDTEKLVITDLEKDLFMKAMLTDVPLRMRVELFGGQMWVDLRTRTTYEQKRVFDIVQLDREEKLFRDTDFPAMISRMQQYIMALQVERINDVLFSDLKLEEDKATLLEDATKLRQFVKEKLSAKHQIKWSAMLNAARIFESKCARLSTMAANEDFWKPRTSG